MSGPHDPRIERYQLLAHLAKLSWQRAYDANGEPHDGTWGTSCSASRPRRS